MQYVYASMNTVVHALWLGTESLSHLEQLTLHSFAAFGSRVRLWHYDPIRARLPGGVELCDAGEILPRERIFRYPPNMILNFGHNSYAGFSDVFRYKVLYEHGGWWSDMDVTCLKPLDEVREDYWFRFHGVLSMVGNVMKVPARSELMKVCFERASEEVNGRQRDWHHAIRILCYNVERLGLGGHIHHDACNLDRLDFVYPLVHEPQGLDRLPPSWRFIHWMNSVVGQTYHPRSVMGRLMEKFGCPERKLHL